MNNTGVRFIIGGLATAAVLGYSHLGFNQREILTPSNIYNDIKFECCLPEEFYQNDYYTIGNQNKILENQIEIIHNFVSALIENTQELDPRISKLIDDHFWELG